MNFFRALTIATERFKSLPPKEKHDVFLEVNAAADIDNAPSASQALLNMASKLIEILAPECGP